MSSSNVQYTIEINSMARNMISSIIRDVYCKIDDLELNRKDIDSEESEWSSDEDDGNLKEKKNAMIMEEIKIGNKESENVMKNEFQNKNFYDKEESDKEREARFKVDIKLGEKLTQVGTIDAFVDDTISVVASSDRILNQENTQIQGDYKVLGPIQDIFGNLKEPRYLVFSDKYLKTLKQNHEVSYGMEVFVLTRTENFISDDILKQLKSNKYYDQDYTNKDDNENAGFYSDDEQEEKAVEQRGLQNKRNPEDYQKKGSHNKKDKNWQKNKNYQNKNVNNTNMGYSNVQSSNSNVQNQGMYGHSGVVNPNQQYYDQYMYQNVQYYQQQNPINNQGYQPNQVFMQNNPNQFIPGAIPTQNQQNQQHQPQPFQMNNTFNLANQQDYAILRSQLDGMYGINPQNDMVNEIGFNNNNGPNSKDNNQNNKQENSIQSLNKSYKCKNFI